MEGLQALKVPDTHTCRVVRTPKRQLLLVELLQYIYIYIYSPPICCLFLCLILIVYYSYTTFSPLIITFVASAPWFFAKFVSDDNCWSTGDIWSLFWLEDGFVSLVLPHITRYKPTTMTNAPKTLYKEKLTD